MKFSITIPALLSLLFFICPRLIYAQDDAAQKAWIAYKTPGDIHKTLAADEGQWATEVTTWMAPGAAPTKSMGACENKMILGGRYLETHHTGTMMGMPFEGWGTIGYDNAKKIFVSSWVDNFGTGMMYMEGTWDDAAKTMISKGKAVDPETGKDMDFKEVYKVTGDKTRLMEMYITMPDGQEFKTMEIKYSKK